RQGGGDCRRDGRVRIPRRRGQEVNLRIARDHPASARTRLREADLPLQRSRYATDRCARACDRGGPGITAFAGEIRQKNVRQKNKRLHFSVLHFSVWSVSSAETPIKSMQKRLTLWA